MADTIIGTVADWEEIYRKTLTPYISHTYIADGSETPIPVVGGVATKYILPVTPKKLNGFSVYDPGGLNQALQVDSDGAVDKSYKLDASTSMYTSANNCNVFLYLYKNSVLVAGSQIQRKVGTGADVGAMGLASTFDASDGDLLEVYVMSDTSTDLTFKLTSIVITEV